VSTNELAPLAQVASSVIAACGLLLTAFGLVFTALQIRRTRRTGDLQALQKFHEDANKREAALAEARTKGEEEFLHAFNEYLNFLEIYACAYNNELIIGQGSKDIVRHKLVDGFIEVEAAERLHPHIEAALDRSTTR
jgi:hypothetical protein